MLNITDSRFQDKLIREAKLNGKLAADFELAPEYKQNYPEKIESLLKPFRDEGHFAPFPFGTDLTDEEIAIGGSLKQLAAKKKTAVAKCLIAEIFKPVPNLAKSYLRRMQLDKPGLGKEKILQKVVLSAIRANGQIGSKDNTLA